jgi:hypothetical protein
MEITFPVFILLILSILSNKLLKARMRSPLRIRASNKATDFSTGDQALPQLTDFSIC